MYITISLSRSTDFDTLDCLEINAFADSMYTQYTLGISEKSLKLVYFR